jgi:NTE family protein
MKKCMAFVLGGGGARGAFQVGALKALLEAGYQPDLMVGTSVGAINAAFLALRGANLESIQQLIEVWSEASHANLMPTNYLSLTLRKLVGRSADYTGHRMRDFCIHHGLTPDICFKEIKGMRLILVAADLNSGQPVLYGTQPDDSILEGVLASTALPPWIPPLEKDGRLLVDGGAVSVLPIEAAIKAGASEIIALDLNDTRAYLQSANNLVNLFGKMVATANHRQAELELALADALGLPVRHIRLLGVDPIAIWDFELTETRIARGYALTRDIIETWRSEPKSRFKWWQRRERHNQRPQERRSERR